MTHPHECQLIYSPLSNLSLWINKAIRSIRKISTSMFATRHLCGVTYGIENLQRNHCACTLEIARRGLVDQNGDAIHNYIICWLFALMYFTALQSIFEYVCELQPGRYLGPLYDVKYLYCVQRKYLKKKYLMFTTMWSLHLQKRPSQSLFTGTNVAMQMCNIHLFWHWLWPQLNNALFVDCISS